MKRFASLSLAAFAIFAFVTSAFAQTPARGPQPTPACGPSLTIKNVDKQSRCFELRTYTVREGSSIDLLHSRFRDHTTALFKKHGMTVIGYWQPVAKPDTLIYILAYKDAAARDASWAAFNVDPGVGQDANGDGGERSGRQRLHVGHRLLADEVGIQESRRASMSGCRCQPRRPASPITTPPAVGISASQYSHGLCVRAVRASSEIASATSVSDKSN